MLRSEDIAVAAYYALTPSRCAVAQQIIVAPPRKDGE
jgi:hypothetical protein